MLTNSDLVELTAFRRALHKRPEVSGEEAETAKMIVGALKALQPTKILTGLGGHGVAAVFDTGVMGPTVLFRAELDALPILEVSDIPWKSEIPGKGHMCGHDGHMTILLALGRHIARKPVTLGRIILMFQPAEEDGSGARAVIADPAYDEICPDWAFALHNEPGRPWGYVAIQAGLMNCASQGLKITLNGKTAHAANPEYGVSPARAVAELIPALDDLGHGGEINDEFRLVTITHTQIGEPSFGIAPGSAVLYATLRTAYDASMTQISKDTHTLTEKIAKAHGLTVSLDIFDDFAASINDPQATKIAIKAMDALSIQNGNYDLPMRASEDFGIFGQSAKAAMLCIGTGENRAALHNPDYDFPDDLIPLGSAIFERIARDLCG